MVTSISFYTDGGGGYHFSKEELEVLAADFCRNPNQRADNIVVAGLLRTAFYWRKKYKKLKKERK